MNTENELELTDDVPGARTNIRETNPALYGDDAPPATSKLEDLTEEDLAAIAGDDDDGDEADDGKERERDTSGRFVPRARIDELTIQRNKERERAEAAEAKAAQLEKERQDAAEAARLAAEAKAKELHDFDADRDALQAKFDANEIDLSEFNRETRKLDKAERQQDLRVAEENAVARIKKEQAAEREKAEQESFKEIEADAVRAAQTFMADPENAEYKTDHYRRVMLDREREIIFKERDGNIGWDELLVEAKKRVEAYIADKKPAAKPSETEAERVARDRRERQARATAEASSLPARPDGGRGGRATAEPEDENDITPEEFRRLPKAERDRRLGKTA